MPRGERVGDAYVRIHAEGSGIARDVRDEFENLDPVMRDLGKRHAQEYQKGQFEQMKKQQPLLKKEILKGVDFQRGVLDAKAQAFTDDFLKSLRKKFRAAAGDKDVGNRMGQLLMDQVQAGMLDEFDLSRLFSQMEDVFDEEGNKIGEQFSDDGAKFLARLRKQALEDIQRAEDEAHAEALRRNEEFNRKVAAQLEASTKAQEDADKKRRDSLQRTSDFRNRMWQQQISEDQKTLASVQGLVDAFNRLKNGTGRLGETYEDVSNKNRELSRALKFVHADTEEADDALRRMRAGLITLTPRINRAQAGFNKLADTVGVITGRGSRNNFLNFVGSVNRNMIRLAGGVVFGFAKMGQAAVNFFNDIRKNGVAFEDLKRLGISAVQALGGGITTLITFGAIIAAVGVSVGVLSALVSGLAAAITALAGTITFALIGGVVALAGAVVPLAAGIGLVAAAVLGLSDAQKEALGNDLQPLADAFGNLADVAGNFLFRDVGKWAKELAPVIDLLEPAVVRVANSIHNTVDTLISDLASSGKVEHFIDRLTNKTEDHMSFLGTATKKIGDIFTNVGEGLAGVFLASLPLINRFLGWLRDVTQEFSDWANTAKGRAEIREFLKNAGDSASALGDFLGDATRLLSKLLGLGREQGDTMFRDMATAMGDFVDYLSSPEGQAAARDWLEWGRELGESIGNMIVAVGKFIGALDTPQTRSIVTFLIDGFSKVLEFLGKYPEAIAVLAGPVGVTVLAVTKLVDLFQWLWDLLSQSISGSWIADIAGVIGDVVGSIGQIDDAFGALGDALGISDTWFGDLLGSIGQIDDALGAVSDLIFGGGGTPWVTHVTKDFQDATGAILVTDDTVKTLIGSLDQVTGAATAATRAMALQALQEGKVVEAGNQLGISTRTLVDAALGQKDAIHEVQTALQKAWRAHGPLTEAQRSLFGVLRKTFGALRDEKGEILDNSQAVQDYTGKLKGLPHDVKVFIRNDSGGIRATTKGIAEVVAAAKELAPDLSRRQIKTIIEASGVTATQKRLHDVLKAVEELDDKKGNPSVGLDKALFDRLMADVDKDLKDTDKKKTEPSAHLDLAPFLNDKGKLMGDLANINKEKATPKASLDLQQFYNDRGLLIASLHSIPDEHVNIITHRIDGGGNGPGEGGADIRDDGTGVSKTVVTPGGRGGGNIINVYPQASDPRAVAQETLNRLAAKSY